MSGVNAIGWFDTLEQAKDYVRLNGSTDLIIKEQNLKLDQIDSFEFANGSGSFTGIKTGAAIANILQWALKGTSLDQLHVPEYGAEPNITPHPKL